MYARSSTNARLTAGSSAVFSCNGWGLDDGVDCPAIAGIDLGGDAGSTRVDEASDIGRAAASRQSGWGVGRASASVGSLGSVQTSVPDVWYFVEKMGWSQSSSRWAHGATAARDHQPDGRDGTVGLGLVADRKAQRRPKGSRHWRAAGQQGDCIVEELLTADEPRWGNGRGRGGLCRETGRRLSTMS